MFEYRHRTLLIAVILFAAIGLNADRPVDVIHVPPAETNGTASFDPAEQQNYFRNRGTVTGVSAYAHITMELDFQMISHLIEKGCSCLDATKAWEMRKTPEGEFIKDTTGYKIIFEGILIMESSCIHLKSEAEKLERSFTAVDSEINRFRATYNNLQQSMRQKRVVGAVIGAGLIGGLMGSAGGFGLSALVLGSDFDSSDIWERIELEATRVHHLENEYIKLDNWATVIQKELQKEVQLSHITTIVNSCNNMITDLSFRLRPLFNGVNGLIKGKLGTGLVDPFVLATTLERIDMEANRRRQNIAVRNIHEIYQLPVSIQGTEGRRITFAVHVPLFEIRNQLSLWEFVATPIEIAGNHTLGDANAYRIINKNEYLAISKDLYFKEFNQAELNECQKFGTTYVCEHTVLTRDVDHSCLAGIYRGNNNATERECEVELLSYSEATIAQVGPNEFAAYFPLPTIVVVECEIYAAGRAKSEELTGAYLITIPNGCRGVTPNFRFSPIEDIGEFHSLVVVPDQLRIHVILNKLPEIEKKAVRQELAIRHSTRISLSKLKSSIRNKLHWVLQWPKRILIGIAIAIGVGFLAFCLLPICIGCLNCRWNKKMVSYENNHMGMRFNENPQVITYHVQDPPSSTRNTLNRSLSYSDIAARSQSIPSVAQGFTNELMSSRFAAVPSSLKPAIKPMRIE